MYGGSASKTLRPALRLGWLVAARRTWRRGRRRRGCTDAARRASTSSRSPTFIERGELDRHCAACACATGAGATRLVEALARHLPEAEIGGAAAGLHVTVVLAPDTDVDAVLARAAARGVALLATHHEGHPLLLVGYANITGGA